MAQLVLLHLVYPYPYSWYFLFKKVEQERRVLFFRWGASCKGHCNGHNQPETIIRKFNDNTITEFLNLNNRTFDDYQLEDDADITFNNYNWILMVFWRIISKTKNQTQIKNKQSPLD